MAVAISFVFVTPRTQAAMTAYGDVTDPAGDSLDASLDLVFASISVACTGDATFRIRYAPGYDPTAGHAVFALDLDQDTSTGLSWFGMGVDATVGTYGTGFQGTGFYQVFGSSSGARVPTAISYLSDGTEVSVPLSVLGATDEVMNFHVSCETQLEDNLYTSIRDWMPERDADFKVGVAVVSLVADCTPTVPAPGAILLGTLGAGLVGFLRRRRTL